jgi:ABC-type antimicrobial peptide transport system permease subunit
MLGATPAVLVARTLWNAASLLAGGALIGVLLAFWTVHLVGTGVLRVELAFADIVPGLTGAVLIVLVVSYIGASRVALDLMERRL